MNELIVIEKQNVLNVFTQDKAINPILESITKQARSFVADVSTPKGRKDIASMSYKVAQTKTYLDSLGKDLVDEMKELPKKVDASRKYARDYLDQLKNEVRSPLDLWEKEQAEIESKKIAEAEAEAMRAKVEADHVLGLFMNIEFDRTVKEKSDNEIRLKLEKEALEKQAQIERELILVKQAEEKLKIEYENKIKDEREAQDRLLIEQKLATERAEREKNVAIELERKRVADEKAKHESEVAAREADVEHRKNINNSILKSMVEASDISYEQAKIIVIAISKGTIQHISINY